MSTQNKIARELSFWRAALVAAALWVLIPSSVFLAPHAVTFLPTAQGGYEVAFARATRFGDVRASWHAEIRARAECDDQDDGLTLYEERGLAVVPFALSDKLAACIEPGTPFAFVTTLTVYLAGLIPLRPSQSVFYCRGIAQPCEEV
jgi:hypothetical protein